MAAKAQSRVSLHRAAQNRPEGLGKGKTAQPGKAGPGHLGQGAETPDILLAAKLPVLYFRFSGFRHSSSGRTNLPSFRISLSSNQISPPPYSGVMISTRSQWIADLLPLGASS